MALPDYNNSLASDSHLVNGSDAVGSASMTAEASGASPTETPSPIITTILISNLHCASCCHTIRQVLSALSPRPLSISCNILSHEVTVIHPAELATIEILQRLLEVEFDINCFKSTGISSEIASGGYGSVDGFGPNGRRRSWLNEAGGKLRSAFESGRKGRKHLETCEQCKEEYNRNGISPYTIRHSKDIFEPHSEGSLASASIVDCKTLPYSNMDKESKPKRPYSLAVLRDRFSSTLSPNILLPGLRHSRTTYDGTLDSFSKEIDLAFKEVSVGGGIGLEIGDANIVTSSPTTTLYEALFSIEGMTCSACTGRVNETIEALPFVCSAEIVLISNSATVRFEGQKEDAQRIVDEIEDIGYGCTLESVREVGVSKEKEIAERSVAIQVDGMFCDHCPPRILSALETFIPRLKIEKPPSLTDPIVRITYTPSASEFTIREIFTCIKESHPSFKPSIYHPPSIEERSRQMLEREQWRLYVRLVCCIIVAIPTFTLGIVYMSLVPKDNRVRMFLSEYMWAGRVTRMEWALFFLATPVQFFIADVFHKRAFKDIKGLWRKGSAVPILRRFYRFGSMNLLVSLGVSIAYFASVALLGIAATTNPHVHGNATTYFDSTVFLTMFLLMGRCLESYSKSKTADAVSMLGKLRPTEALLVIQAPEIGQSPSGESNTTNASIKKIPVDLLETGDLLCIPHGGSPPADGEIVFGETKFDESSLTGEARLVQKKEGDTIYVGTINRGKIVHARVGAVAGESMLDQIVRIVREGQARRAPIERIADVITGYFVPVVTLIAIATWVTWLALGQSGTLPKEWLDAYQGGWAVWSLGFAIAVFVVACPCGIGLAAPTALFVGSGLAARHGILAKGGGEAFQEASLLDCVVFDKTGTLTEGGEPSVTDTEIIVNEPDEIALVYGTASALEENSSHPLAKAVVNYCQSRKKTHIVTTDVEEVPGRGLRGTIIHEKETYSAIIGNESFMEENGVAFLGESIQEMLEKWKSCGKSVVLLAMKKPSETRFTLSATFAATDPLRPEAKHVISSLKKDGIAVYMISGDNPTTALAIALMVGIPRTNVIAGVLPTQKAEMIQYLQKAVRKRPRGGIFGTFGRSSSQIGKSHRAIVAMVGDGINDAPALATSDVGIAIGSGSDIALSSAKFILLTSNLTSLLTLTSLSRKVLRRVKFNFFWACVYNMVALPFAAGAFFAIDGGVKGIRLDPVWASLAMACSSVSVVCSSLLLRSRLPGLGYRAPRFPEVVQKQEKEKGAEEKV